MGSWLLQVKEAADDAEELVKDMETGESAIPDIMAWFRSDSSNLLRMKYSIGRLVSVCTEGESLLGFLNRMRMSGKACGMTVLPRHLIIPMLLVEIRN